MDVGMNPEEQDLIGAAILAPELTNTISLSEQDFASPQAGAIWRAIGAIHAMGRQPDPVLILEETRRYGVPVDHSVIIQAVGCGMAVNADVYADKIRDNANRRRLKDQLLRAQQMLTEGTPVEQVLGDITSGFDATSPIEAEVARAMSLDEFVGQRLPPQEWVIPGLLAKGDRLVLTGTEGAGKTMLMREFGIAAAAGRNPFTMDAMPPIRVLYIDCENPLTIMVKTMTKMVAAMKGQGVDFGDRMWVSRHPQGLDLASAKDRLLLHTMCRTFQPDLLLIGPAYKLYQGGAGAREEDLARQVTGTLDGLREEFGFALILEHHSPHGQQTMRGFERSVRPIGSSLWLRWPEFGFGLKLVTKDDEADFDPDLRKAKVVPWRGQRDQRDWPTMLIQGAGGMPWVAEGTPGY